jgi:hypothetical protein
MIISANNYQEFLDKKLLPEPKEDIYLVDHLGGFDRNLNNDLLEYVSQNFKNNTVFSQYVIDQDLIARYPNIRFERTPDLNYKINFEHFHNYRIHSELKFEKFLCSFNGSEHVSRRFLVSILEKFGWFDPEICSKNFSFSINKIDGSIEDFVPDTHSYYRKFFIGKKSKEFFQSVYTFDYNRYDHKNNIYTLENKITQSFLHIVSETMATSYYPFVTEKFLYSIVTRGLFLAYAQPGWHEHLEKYYGFRRYDTIFDYRFDQIKNPIERLVELMSMISKFSTLSSDDWRDLYEMESETIEHNYDWYFSKQYIRHLEKFSS